MNFKTLFVVLSGTLISFISINCPGASDDIEYPAPSTYADVGLPTESGWQPFQVGLLPDYPLSTRNSRVNGLKLGLPFSGGKRAIVNGVELAVLGSSTYTVEGWQAALLVCAVNHIDGAQTSILTSVGRQVNGVQLSLVNVARVLDGWQIALYNAATYDIEGLQLGVVNSSQSVDGVQIGLFNITEKQGFQIGLINVIEDGWLPFSILVNWSYPDDEKESGDNKVPEKSQPTVKQEEK